MGELSTLKPLDWLTPREWADSTKTLSFMDRLYNRLDGAYPNRWRAAFAGDGAIQNWREAWAEAFSDEGLSPREIGDGLKRCRKMYDWPPSLAEFIRACRPQIDYEAAYNEAVLQMRKRETGEDHWSDPAIYWAAVSVGDFDLRHGTFQTVKVRWKQALEAAKKGIKGGDIPSTIPARLMALPAPENRTLSKEEAKERINKLRERFRFGMGKNFLDQIETAIDGGGK